MCQRLPQPSLLLIITTLLVPVILSPSVLHAGPLAAVPPAAGPPSANPTAAAPVQAVAGSLRQITGIDDTLWFLTRGTERHDEAWAVDTDTAGNIYLATFQIDPGPWTEWVVYCFSPDGEEVWQTRWGSPWQDRAFIAVVHGPHLLVGGNTWVSSGAVASQLAVVAFDLDDGEVAWEFTWDGGPGYEEIDGLVVAGDRIYCSGWTDGKTTSNDIVVLALDLEGSLDWVETWGSERWDEANGQIVVDDDRVWVAGRYDAPNIVFGGESLLVAFSRADGSYLEHTTWGDGGAGSDNALGMTSDGTDLYVAGYTDRAGSGIQLELRRIRKDLSLVWERFWGGSGAEFSRVLEVDDGQLLVAGKSDSFGSGEHDLVLLRYTLDGDLLWNSVWGGSERDETHGLALHQGYAFIVGQTESFGAGQADAILVKADGRTGEFPGLGPVKIVAAPGPGPDNPTTVRVFEAGSGGSLSCAFTCYPVDSYGANVAAGDLDGDGEEEILTGPGPGEVFGPHVRAFRFTGVPFAGNAVNFLAYGTPRYGVNVSAGDLDGDGRDEILTGAGPGAVFGPHVRAFRFTGSGVESLPEVSFFAYGTLRYGVNVAAGDLDGNGRDEIVTGAGPGAVFGPHVRGWRPDGNGNQPAPIPGVSYFAYGTLRWGVNVACGDLDGDGIDEIVTSPGPGAVFGSHVRGWSFDGEETVPLAAVNFFAYDPSGFRYGAVVALGDLDGDGFDEIVTCPGPGDDNPAEVRVWNHDGGTGVELVEAFVAFDPDEILLGARVAVLDTGSGRKLARR